MVDCVFTAGGVGFGAGGRAVTPGAGTLASAGAATGVFGVDMFGNGSVTSGCTRAVGTVLPAFAGTGFAGLAGGLFAATLPAGAFRAGGFRAAGTFTAATARLDAGGFAAVFDGGAFGALAVAGLSTVALAEVGGFDSGFFAGSLTAGLSTVALAEVDGFDFAGVAGTLTAGADSLRAGVLPPLPLV